jgi:predicted metal-binding membrane protein
MSMSTAAAPSPHVRRFAPFAFVAGLSLAAWATLALWTASPYARYVEHAGWADAGALAALCRAIPQGDVLVPLALHALAWLLMVSAMMLPTALPLVALFRRLVAGRDDAAGLTTRVLAGYALAWLAFGVIAHALDALVRVAAQRSDWLALHGAWVAAFVLVGAGLFQFSALKYRCLEQCRTPFSFVTSRWSGRAPARDAWRIGIDHGVFCVGCCWAIMLVMFVVGVGSVGWMLALAAIMAAEKNLPWGKRLRTPLGVALIGWGSLVAVGAA